MRIGMQLAKMERTVVVAMFVLLFRLALFKKANISLLTLLPYYHRDPFLDPSWNEGDNIVPAINLAVDQVNNSSMLLQNYTLQLVHAEAGCNQVTRTLVNFVKETFAPESVLAGIIGPGCSSSSISLGSFTSRPELGLVMTHGSGSPLLADRIKYPYLLGALGSTEGFVEGFLYLLNKARWKRVAILYDDSRSYYKSTLSLLLKRIPSNVSIEFLSAVADMYIMPPLAAIQAALIRIVFVLCPPKLSRDIICLLSHNNMTYSNYQWVFMSKTFDELSTNVTVFYEDNAVFCSKTAMRDALNFAFLMIYKLVPSAAANLVSNTTYLDYLDLYEEYRVEFSKNTMKNSSYTFWATYFYDIVWAWGLVLDELTNHLDFSMNYHGSESHSNLILDQFYKTSFQGMSGKLSFNESTGFAPREVNLSQVINDYELTLAFIGVESIESILELNQTIPDSFSEKIVKENSILSISFALVLLILLFIVVFLHVATSLLSKKPSVKAASLKLLHFSYVGIYIMTLGGFIWTLFLGVSNDLNLRGYFCQLLWAWCLPIGFTLSFAPVGMRTWRIFRIFKHYHNPGPLISDPILMGAVILLLFVDIIVGTLWTFLDSFDAKVVVDGKQGDVVKAKLECRSEHFKVWISIVLAYHLGLLLLITVIAIKTRNIKNRSFAVDALYILIYIMVFLLVLSISLYVILFLFNCNPDYHFSTLAGMIISIILAFIICVFLPPLIPVMAAYYKSKKV